MAIPVRVWPRVAITLGRTYGLRGALLRAVHELRRRVGAFRAEPRWRPETPPRQQPASVYRVDPDRLSAATDPEAALVRADRVLEGEYEAYRWDWRPFPADPDGWTRHPRSGIDWAGGEPWWRVPHLDPVRGDIKDLWEPARFGWAYDLVRGYLLTRRDDYARAFHDRLAEWLESSPPFSGPHWSCGQETSIRAAALLYAEANLVGAPSSTEAAMARLEAVLAASGERIADALEYALSQRNNHGISESTGLILLGSRLQDAHPRADRWLRRGRRWMDRLIREQIADDGWYIQHSFNYLRVALDQCVLASRALGSQGLRLSAGAVARIGAAVELLGEVVEPTTGIVPNHGPNDGAFVHPITLARYRDFRPTLTAACASFGLPLPAGIAPDPEVLAWLGAEQPRTRPVRVDGVRVGSSGWAVARVGDAAVFLRAGRYGTRPGHIDPLHLDVRLGGREVVVDPGTYSYSDPPLDRQFASGRVHNGPMLSGREQGVPGPRFLWLTWPEAAIERADHEAGVAELVAEVPGAVRRTVVVHPDRVEVTDRPLRRGGGEVSVRWLLHPDADPARVRSTPEGRRYEAEPDSALGWFSPRYGEKVPAPGLEVRGALDPDGRLVTRILP